MTETLNLPEPWPNTSLYTSSQFLISAGCLLFRLAPDTQNLQLCIIFHKTLQKWVLPKGRKNCNESIEAAAVRETFEETGYPCELLPCRMPTRSPQPGLETFDTSPSVVDNAVEPIAVYVHELVDVSSVKFMWWFIARLKQHTAERLENTQAAFETYESRFFDVEDAISCLYSTTDQQLATRAADIVRDTAGVHPNGLLGLFHAA